MPTAKPETVVKIESQGEFVPPFMIAFFISLIVSGICAFVNVCLVNKMTKERMRHIPKAKKVKAKKGKKGKKSKH